MLELHKMNLWTIVSTINLNIKIDNFVSIIINALKIQNY